MEHEDREQKDNLDLEYNDLTIIRIPNGYFVKIEALGDNAHFVRFLDEVKRLMKYAKNLEGKALYVGFCERSAAERKDKELLRWEINALESYRERILEERSKVRRMR